MIGLNRNALDLVERNLVRGAIVERCPGRLVRRNLLGMLQRTAVFQKYVVIPVARNVWQPIFVLMPATLARRRIITHASHASSPASGNTTRSASHRVQSTCTCSLPGASQDGDGTAKVQRTCRG
jgi:hypothetical protein